MLHTLTALDRVAALPRSLYPIDPLSVPRSTKPLWGLGHYTPSFVRTSRVCDFMPAMRAAFAARQGHTILTRRLSSFRGYRHQEMIPSVSGPTSLIPTSRFKTSPVSFGVLTWRGYDPFILPGTRLPCRETAIFQSDFDYVEDDVLPICFCPPLKEPFKVIAELAVSGVRKAKKEDSRMTLIMDLDEDLTGTLTARFTPQERTTKGEVLTKFDGRLAGGRTHENDVIAL